MTRLRWLGLLAAVLVSVLGGIWVMEAQAPVPPPSKATTPDRPPTSVVRRAVMPDGTVEFEYADGTKRRVPGAVAQQTTSETTPPDLAGSSGQDQIAPVAPPAWLDDPATRKAFLDAMGEYYRASGLQHRRRSIRVAARLLKTHLRDRADAGRVWHCLCGHSVWCGPEAREHRGAGRRYGDRSEYNERQGEFAGARRHHPRDLTGVLLDRKSTRLNSSHRL